MCKKTFDPAARKVIPGTPVITAGQTAEALERRQISIATGFNVATVEKALAGKLEGPAARLIENVAARRARHAERNATKAAAAAARANARTGQKSFHVS